MIPKFGDEMCFWLQKCSYCGLALLSFDSLSHYWYFRLFLAIITWKKLWKKGRESTQGIQFFSLFAILESSQPWEFSSGMMGGRKIKEEGARCKQTRSATYMLTVLCFKSIVIFWHWSWTSAVMALLTSEKNVLKES